MKLAFSTSACHDWDLPKILAQASAWGYDQIELAGLSGRAELPLQELLLASREIRQQLAEARVGLASLASRLAFHHPDMRTQDITRRTAVRHFELARCLGCPVVRVIAGFIPRRRLIGYEPRQRVITRIISALRELAAEAASAGVTIAVENAGHLLSARDLWHIVDAVDHPAVRVCWNPCNAAAVGETPSLTAPQLAARMQLVRLSDALTDPQGRSIQYRLPGQGSVQIARCIELLRGLAYQGSVVFVWPRSDHPELAGPDQVLPAAGRFLRQLIEAKPVELSAYKADKYAPRFAARTGWPSSAAAG